MASVQGWPPDALVRTYPVLEIFGPVIQGEGPVAGKVTHFVRFGLCDYRCSWCDSMFAVDPAQVRTHATRLDTKRIVEHVGRLTPSAPWVTLSGGNPVIHDLEMLVDELQGVLGMDVAVETQGSKWSDWLYDVDMLVVSPKPPSSGMVSKAHRQQTEHFMRRAERLDPSRRAIKIVVFDETDLDWADGFMVEWPWAKLYLSVGTDPPEVPPGLPAEPIAITRRKVCDRYRWLGERVPYLTSEVTICPQLHVLAYGHQRGV